MKTISSFVLHMLGEPYFVLKEAAQIAYGDDFVQFPNEKDLLRAHLVVELIERYRYPPEAIGVGLYVPVRQNGVEYTEVDIVVHDSSHKPFILAAVGEPQHYEYKKEEALSKLFAIALLMQNKPHYLLYYTRWYEGKEAARKTKHLVVNCAKHQTFSAWQKTGRPSVPDIPGNRI